MKNTMKFIWEFLIVNAVIFIGFYWLIALIEMNLFWFPKLMKDLKPSQITFAGALLMFLEASIMVSIQNSINKQKKKNKF